MWDPQHEYRQLYHQANALAKLLQYCIPALQDSEPVHQLDVEELDGELAGLFLRLGNIELMWKDLGIGMWKDE